MKNSTIKLNSEFFLMLTAWFLLLLFPLLKLIPTPSSQPSHPWQTELIAAVILIAALVWIAVKKIDLKINKTLVIPLLLFILWSGISVFWAKSELSVAHHTWLWLAYLLFYCVFLVLLRESETRPTLLVTLAAILSIVSLLCVFDMTTMADFRSNEGIFRIRYAKYAEVLLTAAPIFWALALQIKNRRALFFTLGCGVLLWIGVAFSLSKGAMLAGVFAFAIFFAAAFIFTRKIYDRRKIAVLFALWLVVTFASQVSFMPNAAKPSTTDYFTGAADQTRMTSHFRLFTWKISGQMIQDNWVKGVGADNFGLRFNQARTSFAEEKPSDPHLATAEDHFVQRAHNEFLQIFAELGFVGVSIFLLMMIGFAGFFARAFKANGYRFPPILWACLAGLGGFFASSMVSSFSFRLLPNGIVFFFVLALAVYEAQKILRRKKAPEAESKLAAQPTYVFAFSAVAIFFAVSLAANLSNYFVSLAESKKEISEAEPYFEKAVALNPENSVAYFTHGMKYYFDKQPEKAAPLLEKAVSNGFDVSIAYFYLASAQASAGDPQAAEKTLAEAVSIFPHSVFLQTRYALLLEANNKRSLAAGHLQLARLLDSKQAQGWFELMTTGARAAALKSRAEKNFPEPSDLLPGNAVYAVIDEQNVEKLFPETVARQK